MNNLKRARQIRAVIPERESAAEYERFEPESRLICNILKMTAYHIERQLTAILKHYWRGINGNERGILDGFLQATRAVNDHRHSRWLEEAPLKGQRAPSPIS